MTSQRPGITTTIAALAVLAAAESARAEETTCRGLLAVPVVDNLRVPAGAKCLLSGTFVQGTVKVERGATLDAAGIQVIGDIQGENARAVRVRSSRVGGSVQLVQGGTANVSGTDIQGDLQLESNRGELRAARNEIGGSLQAFQNTGGLTINYNRIDGNLQCKENSPRPVGQGNVVQGNKEDQCARL